MNFGQNQKLETTEYVCMRVCVVCVIDYKYDILRMPLHLFEDDANCRIDYNHVETLTI